MKNRKWLALALTAVLLVCLLPASALAAEDEPAEITNEKDGVMFNSGDIIYNNEGVVYNNSGVVYNNGGTVYNNGGVAYNNGGVVYNNGGTVYNNEGTVYNNEGTVVNHNGTVAQEGAEGQYQIETAEDYSAYIQIDGVEETDGVYTAQADSVCIITPKEGYTIDEADASAGELEENEDGSYTLSKLDKSARLTLSIRLAPPAFSMEGGTFGSDFSLELSAAAEGAEVYYTLDGTEPQENSERYKQPIAVEGSMTVCAVAVDVYGKVLQSESAKAEYALPELTTPIFDAESEGYEQPDAQGLTVVNDGDIDAVIAELTLDGETPEAFILNTTEGAAVPAGETDETTWTIQPAADLQKGAYSARLTVTFDSGDTTVLFLSFKVK